MITTSRLISFCSNTHFTYYEIITTNRDWSIRNPYKTLLQIEQSLIYFLQKEPRDSVNLNLLFFNFFLLCKFSFRLEISFWILKKSSTFLKCKNFHFSKFITFFGRVENKFLLDLFFHHTKHFKNFYSF